MTASKTDRGQTEILSISAFILKGRIETETHEWEDMVIHVPKFCLRSGMITAVIGGSGCGKSVFFSLLMGCPAFGIGGKVEMSRLCVFGEHLQGTAFRSVRAMANWRKKLHDFGGLFYLPQAFPVAKTQRVPVAAAMIQVVQALILPICKSRREILAAIKESFYRHELSEVIDKKNMSQLSGGERRRAELLARIVAMKLARRPAILILDEPTTGFDPANARQFIRDVRSAIDELCRDGVCACALFSTHEMSCLDDKGEDGERRVVDNVCIIHRDVEGDGKGNCVVLHDGPAETVWHRFFPNDKDDKTYASDGESLFEILKTKTTDEWLKSEDKENNHVS